MHLKNLLPPDSNYVNYEVCTITSTFGVSLPLLSFSSIDESIFKP